MRPKLETHSNEAEKTVRDIRRATRRQFAAEEKVRIVIAGLRGEDSIAELCRKEGINQNLYYRWSKDFLEAGKKRLAGDTAREASSDEVKGLRAEMVTPGSWATPRILAVALSIWAICVGVVRKKPKSRPSPVPSTVPSPRRSSVT